MQSKAVLLDLYETCAFADWNLLRDPMSERLGIDRPTLDRAFTGTRPARNLGVYPDLVAESGAILEALGRGGDLAAARWMADETEAFATREIHLYADTLPVVRELRSHGVRLVLVSNCCWETPPFIERAGLRDVFDAVMLSVEHGVRKPDAGAYALALEMAGSVGPADALFVDDQVAFCDGASEFGIPTRQIRRRGAVPAPGMPVGTGDHAVIGSLEELLSPGAGTLEAN